MGRLGDWDKVERKKKSVSFAKSDEYWEYFKMLMIVFVGYLYFHFVIMGWNI